MSAFRHVLLLCAAVLGSVPVVAEGGAAHAQTQAQRTRETINRWPMIFLAAKGDANACGAGCNEWIAAEGAFDPGAPQRLRDLLGTLNGRDLPIYFNSKGGNLGAAHAIAQILRERKMTAGIGRTLLEGCRGQVADDQACRRLMQSKPGLKARLRTADADCRSACVFALIGASIRQVAANARIAVHSPHIYMDLPPERRPKMEDVFRAQKLHAIGLGIDPGLVDAAAKVPSNGGHVLSRAEIARFGIETRGVYETPWMTHPLQGNVVLKSITQPKGVDGKDYRTTRIRVGCLGATVVTFGYRRELAADEIGVPTVVRISAGDREFVLWGRPKDDAAELAATTDAKFVRNAMAAPSIVVTEAFTPPNAPSWSRETRLSTGGLAKASEGLLKDCGDAQPQEKPQEGTGVAGGR